MTKFQPSNRDLLVVQGMAFALLASMTLWAMIVIAAKILF